MRLKKETTGSAIKKSRIRIILLSLSAFLVLSTGSSCGLFRPEVVVLPDSRVLEPHPSKEYWTCISDGYYQEIVKKLEKCAGGK